LTIPVSFGFINIFKSERISRANSILIKSPGVDKLGKENNMDGREVNNPVEM